MSIGPQKYKLRIENEDGNYFLVDNFLGTIDFGSRIEYIFSGKDIKARQTLRIDGIINPKEDTNQ